MKDVVDLVKKIKEGKKEDFGILVEKFEPLIKKYIRCLYKDDKEDVRSELLCAIWEALLKISYYENDGQVVKFIYIALKNKYLELYRYSCKQYYHEINIEEVEIENIQFLEKQYDEILINEDLDQFLEKFQGNKKKIYYSILKENLSDLEISLKYEISRQYVNRIRKELREWFT